jgi:bifunctional DNA-binding transcriptional regulator/antitoxin component of YhaV-PrlF toxin-antitoxin module
MLVTNGTNGETHDEEHKYAELVVLDRAGRIHVPHEYLEQFDIKGHAQLEITDEGILIRQAAQTRTEQVKVDGDGMMPRMGHAGAMTVKREKSKGGFLDRFRRTKED